jgi:hypothetical protein
MSEYSSNPQIKLYVRKCDMAQINYKIGFWKQNQMSDNFYSIVKFSIADKCKTLMKLHL